MRKVEDDLKKGTVLSFKTTPNMAKIYKLAAKKWGKTRNKEEFKRDGRQQKKDKSNLSAFLEQSANVAVKALGLMPEMRETDNENEQLL